MWAKRMIAISALTAAGLTPNTLPAASETEQQELMALLEYLAEFETEDGEWVDPESLPEALGHPELQRFKSKEDQQ